VVAQEELEAQAGQQVGQPEAQQAGRQEGLGEERLGPGGELELQAAAQS
jgi:hypothetical protein